MDIDCPIRPSQENLSPIKEEGDEEWFIAPLPYQYLDEASELAVEIKQYANRAGVDLASGLDGLHLLRFIECIELRGK
jgi:hypothetical protein